MPTMVTVMGIHMHGCMRVHMHTPVGDLDEHHAHHDDEHTDRFYKFESLDGAGAQQKERQCVGELQREDEAHSDLASEGFGGERDEHLYEAESRKVGGRNWEGAGGEGVGGRNWEGAGGEVVGGRNWEGAGGEVVGLRR